MSHILVFFKRLDLYLLTSSLLLCAVGLLMIYSTTFGESSGFGLLARQVTFVCAGFALLLVFVTIDYRYLGRISLVLYIFGVIMLAGLLLFGFAARGSIRWFDLGPFQLQPVEYMKVALVLFLASFFQKHIVLMSRMRYVVTSLAITALPVGLTMLQPDLGSAVVLMAIWFGMLLASGVSRRTLLWLLLFFVAVGAVGWQFGLHDYQRDRVLSFLSPEADPQGTGYNALQAIIAVGSGGFFGRGFARGVVSQLEFLPERQTDFIFASLAEELGFVGAAFLFGLLVFWLYRQIKVVDRARDNYGLLVGVGIFSYFLAQAGFNIAMNIGLVPITGVPLPLISYGGSSLLVSLVAIGILQSIAARAQPVRFT